MQLHFVRLEVEGSMGGCYDSVHIFDGNSTSARRQWRLCGSLPQEDIVSSGNSLLVQFTTDESLTEGGFSVTYTDHTNQGGPGDNDMNQGGSGDNDMYQSGPGDNDINYSGYGDNDINYSGSGDNDINYSGSGDNNINYSGSGDNYANWQPSDGVYTTSEPTEGS